ncbi:MAG: hypothetical protein A2010_05600 [Nitrospirae bacterium GWD2_57_9]|nr:MAG: hypothetical protein A2010_05600 [Nitrospirae bacterium GWD2_57_9]OGW50521.1 MAG: hypothetical protein A2078_02640 [Nitrospirae bacterium GWC2_57_9]
MDITRIRKSIDDLDTMIVTLLAKRADMVSAAGRLKKSGQGVRDPKRVNEVLRHVRERAAAKGLDPAVAEEVYRTIIHCFVSKELKESETRSNAEGGAQCR